MNTILELKTETKPRPAGLAMLGYWPIIHSCCTHAICNFIRTYLKTFRQVGLFRSVAYQTQVKQQGYKKLKLTWFGILVASNIAISIKSLLTNMHDNITYC